MSLAIRLLIIIIFNFVGSVFSVMYTGTWHCLVSIFLISLSCYYIFIIEPLYNLINIRDFSKNRIFNIRELDALYSQLRGLYTDMHDEHEKYKMATHNSEHDELTQCFNRFRFNIVKDDYNKSDRLFIAFFDINNLKKMNDVNGHAAGDVLIRTAADKLNFWCTYGDLYRMGGDEFMVVVNHMSRKDCEALFSKFNSGVGCLNRVTDGFKCLLASGYAYGSDVDKLMKHADKEMYRNKLKMKEADGEEVR